MPMNIGGDGKNAWPYLGPIEHKGSPTNDNLHFDVAKLRQWEGDALARQRASSEGMAPAAARDGVDLKAIEIALRSLGEDAVDQGPASI